MTCSISDDCGWLSPISNSFRTTVISGASFSREMIVLTRRSDSMSSAFLRFASLDGNISK